MPGKKTVCFISHNPYSCAQVKQQLTLYLGSYIEATTWCLMEGYESPIPSECDLFIAASTPVIKNMGYKLPPGKPVLVANRTLEADRLDEVLSLPPGSKVLVPASWEETAKEKIRLLRGYGLEQLEYYPYWPGCCDYPKNVHIAIVTGQHSLPPEIKTVINIGVRTLNLSTFVEMIIQFKLPLEIINDISQHYISTIINSTQRRLKIAEQGERLKKRLQVTLDTVEQAIIAVDEEDKLIVFNPAAEKQLGISAETAVGKNVRELLPEVDFHTVSYTGESIINSIICIKNRHFIVNTSPIIDQSNKFIGAVTTLKPIHEVQEMDTKVRRELKKKGNIAKYTFADIIGESNVLKKAVEMAKIFADTSLAILIEGASGTGKELFAQAIHMNSPRKNAPFVAINFAALPDNLVESELFGYEEGAFTGARKGGKPGFFEDAHTGTIFLDEIGDASLEVQKKLLRVLEEKEVRRVGSGMVTPVDVRVVAATNQNLKELVRLGKYREDLFYRLCAIQIPIPDLKMRKSDIPLLFNYLARKLYFRELKFEAEVLQFLIEYPWPGNIRELQNVTNYLCSIVNQYEMVTSKHLPSYLLQDACKSEEPAAVESFKDQRGLWNVVREFDQQEALEYLKEIILEFKHAAVFKRKVGRTQLVSALKKRNIDCPEHKVRLYLKKLEQAGCVAVGTTRQGSSLTPSGEELSNLLEYYQGDVSLIKKKLWGE